MLGLIIDYKVNWLKSELCGLRVNKVDYWLNWFGLSLTTCSLLAALSLSCHCGTSLFLVGGLYSIGIWEGNDN